MSNSEREEIVATIDARFGGDAVGAARFMRLIDTYVENQKREAKIQVLQRVKGMAVYEADCPEREYVWTWKFDREIAELQSTQQQVPKNNDLAEEQRR